MFYRCFTDTASSTVISQKNAHRHKPNFLIHFLVSVNQLILHLLSKITSTSPREPSQNKQQRLACAHCPLNQIQMSSEKKNPSPLRFPHIPFPVWDCVAVLIWLPFQLPACLSVFYSLCLELSLLFCLYRISILSDRHGPMVTQCCIHNHSRW